MSTLPSNTSPKAILDPNDFNLYCIKASLDVSSGGIWFGDNPFNFTLPVLLVQVALAILVSRLIIIILCPLKQPRFICNVLGGIMLGPSALGRHHRIKNLLYSPAQISLLDTVSMIGLIYSIFLISVKIDVAMALRTARSSWRIGLVTFIFPALVMSFLYFMFVHLIPGIKNPSQIMFFSMMKSFSYYHVIVLTLDELNLISSRLGQLATFTSAVHEAIQWLFVYLGIVIKHKGSYKSIVIAVSLPVAILLTVYVVRPMLVTIDKRTPVGKPVKEAYIVSVLVLVLVLSLVSYGIGMSYFHGPIILGFVIQGGSALGLTIVKTTETIIAEFFLPLFFILVGIRTNIFEINNLKGFLLLQSIIFAGHIAKLLGTILVSLTLNIKLRNALLLGLILNVTGLVELIIFQRWKTLMYIDDQVFTQLVLSMVLVTGTIVPLIGKMYDPDHDSESFKKNQRCNLRVIQTTSAEAEFRILCCIYGEEDVPGIITLLAIANPTLSSPVSAHVFHLSEIMGQAAPILLPCTRQTRKIISSNYAQSLPILRAFDNYLENSRGPVRIHSYINIATYKSMHSAIFNMVQDNFIPFLIIPFHKNERQLLETHIVNWRRFLNRKLQNHAPCTVGILVDKLSKRNMCMLDFSFCVAILFIGGKDDREALALGTRMIGNAGVNVSLIHIVLENEEGDEMESKLDDHMVDNFKMKKIRICGGIDKEKVVKDGVEALKAICEMEMDKYFDLVVVGRRHDEIKGLRDEGNTELMDNAELGVIGDMLASKDFGNGLLSVLVMHQWDGRKHFDCNYSLRSLSEYETSLV